ncbi:MAG TPA: hypothetical protein VH540_06040 [Ktedonobacterales bacterium]|jgi:hypothetical protein
MTTALQQALERITSLTEGLPPEEQARATEQLQALADQLEREREWSALLVTPESQAYLAAREREVMQELAAGQTDEGGWE